MGQSFSRHQIRMGTGKAAVLLLSLLFVESQAGVPTRQKRAGADYDPDKCRETIKWTDVIYESDCHRLCSYRVDTKCEPDVKRVCDKVRKPRCELVGYSDCSMTVDTEIVEEDKLEYESYTPYDCTRLDDNILIDHFTNYTCTTVTSQTCDKKWITDSDGKKAFGGYENCKDIEKQECKPTRHEIEIPVPNYSCIKTSPIRYPVVKPKEREVELMTTRCVAKTYNKCDYIEEEECVDVETKRCTDSLVKVCYGDDSTRQYGVCCQRPTQEEIHTTKCIKDE